MAVPRSLSLVVLPGGPSSGASGFLFVFPGEPSSGASGFLFVLPGGPLSGALASAPTAFIGKRQL